MIRYILLFLFILNILSLDAQIGINTEKPQGVFHIDGNGDNSDVVTNVQATNDLVVTANGRIHIGGPAADIHRLVISKGTQPAAIAGVTIDDTSQKNNYVMVSDANGVGQWKPKPTLPSYSVYLSTGINLTTSFKPTGSYIDLPPGRWAVTVVQAVGIVVHTPAALNGAENAHTWITTQFLDASATVADVVTGAYISGLIFTRSSNNVIAGTIIIHNKTTATKRYSYNALLMGDGVVPTSAYTITNFGGKTGGENTIYAIRLQE